MPSQLARFPGKSVGFSIINSIYIFRAGGGYDTHFLMYRLVVMDTQKENDCLLKFLSIGKNNKEIMYIQLLIIFGVLL